ncbi:TetR family transcriptional regulator [Streptomyces sp. NPDC006283]|uniref:TetR/AcrR family transcriptional regulator n=1 Tax=Streptomyces sp. NPDC006283 TaxID=3156741 RepID=UPI0033B74541
MEKESKRRPGSHDPEGNRRAVLDAARRLFGAHGYTGVGVRAVAAEAGVTPGLVMAYFGTKDGLFRAAVGSGSGVSEDVLATAAQDPGDVPGALARAYLDRWDRLPEDDPWPALIRSALDHPSSAELLRTILEKQVGEPLAQLLGDTPGADVRVALVRSVLFGVIMERYLFAHEPAASVPTAELAPALAEVLGCAFGGDTTRGRPPGDTAAVGPGAVPPAPSPAVPAPAPPAPGAPGDSPSALLARLDEVSRRHQALIGATLQAYGVSLAAYEVLAVLRDAGEPYRRTMGEVAAGTAVRAGGLTQHADRLEAAGLIRRERDHTDRRIVRLRLTPEGLALTGRVATARAAREQELLAPLGPADRRRLASLLGTVGTALGA